LCVYRLIKVVFGAPMIFCCGDLADAKIMRHNLYMEISNATPQFHDMEYIFYGNHGN